MTTPKPEKERYTASEMPYIYWIRYKWVNVQETQDEEPIYLYAGVRPIEEAPEAKAQIDAWMFGRERGSLD